MDCIWLRVANDTDVQLQHPSDSEEAVSCNVGLATGKFLAELLDLSTARRLARQQFEFSRLLFDLVTARNRFLVTPELPRDGHRLHVLPQALPGGDLALRRDRDLTPKAETRVATRWARDNRAGIGRPPHRSSAIETHPASVAHCSRVRPANDLAFSGEQARERSDRADRPPATPG